MVILEKEIEIQINSSFLIPHYKKLGYDFEFRDKLIIPIKHLPKGSHIEITAICDKCGKEKRMMYKTYLKNTTNGPYYCSTCNKIRKNKTMKEKYGHEHALQCEEFVEKKKETWYENYGVEHPMKNKAIKEKQENTMIKNYGTKHPSQNPYLLKKSLEQGYKIKKYKETELYYQGSYEKDFLDLCEKIGILDKVERGFSIKYDFDGGKLIYFPDFFIKEMNTIIEIKSDYWYKIHEEKNIVKEKTCKDLGYNYLLILNKNYTEFLKHSINII